MKAVLRVFEELKKEYVKYAKNDSSFSQEYLDETLNFTYSSDDFISVCQGLIEVADEQDPSSLGIDWGEFDRLVAPFIGKGYNKDYIELVEGQIIFKLANSDKVNPFDRLIKIYQESRLEEMQELIKQEQIYSSNNEFEGLAILNKYHKPVISHIDSEEIHSYHYTYALHITNADLIKLGQLGWCIDEEKHYFYIII